MLSFGHAVYTGVGSFAAIHAMNFPTTLPLPLPLIPLVGGGVGLLCAALLGFVSTRKSGTPFAMITLGIGELVAAIALMWTGFFGGDSGITTNRTYGGGWMGFTFGPAIEVYYLIAVYCLVCTAAIFAFTKTPLGHILNAVRDNPERVEFIGYNPQSVRYGAFMIAGFFSGIGGALAAIYFEIVTAADSFNVLRSGNYLLFTFLGGVGLFFGPIIGAVLLVLASVWLSEISKAWLLYLGLIFMVVVMFAPGGMAGLIMHPVRLARLGLLDSSLWAAALALGVTALLAVLGAACMVEMTYHLQHHAALGPELPFLGTTLNAAGLDSWCGAVLALVTGLGLFQLCRYQLRWKPVGADLRVCPPL